MAIVERHSSPDGQLELVVDRTDDGDWTVGFAACTFSQGHARFGWHTHGDILDAWGYVGSPEERVRAFVDDVISSRRVIVCWFRDGSFTGAQIEDGLSASHSHSERMTYAQPGESFHRRLWNGQQASD